MNARQRRVRTRKLRKEVSLVRKLLKKLGRPANTQRLYEFVPGLTWDESERFAREDLERNHGEFIKQALQRRA
jgi:hypothetical protein